MEQVSNPAEMHNKQEAIAAFNKFATAVGDPAELDLNDPEVIEANSIHAAWVLQVESKAKLEGTDEAELLKDLEVTTFFVDAGFHGTDYLDEVTNDWLSQTLWEAEDKGLSNVAALIQAKIDSISQLIGQD
jgi:hypothetical protein